MGRRRKYRASASEIVARVAALVGVVIGLQLPFESKLIAAVVLGFVAYLATLFLTSLFGGSRKHPFDRNSDRAEPSMALGDPWPRSEPDQHPTWRETPAPSPNRWSVQLLRSIEWHGFEKLCRSYFEALEFRSELTPFGADGGVDIKLYVEGAATPSIIAQCKAWNTEQVGVKEIRELAGVMTSQRVAEGVFLTSSVFTEDARSFARTVGIQLIDGADFVAKLEILPPEKSLALLRSATAGDYQTPTCPSCGIKMRVPRQQRFWGCPNFPRCRHKFKLRDNPA
jgi:restriction system protein